MELSVITVTHNSKTYIADQIRSVISAAEGLVSEQIIVDNASTDGTLEVVQKEFPSVRVIPNSSNRGFGRANNQGVEVSSGKFVLFFNPDNRFLDAGSLKHWLQWMQEHQSVGIAGCKLVNEKGDINLDATPRRFPRVWQMLATLVKLPHVFPSILNTYLYRSRDFNLEQEVDSVRGSCMLVRRELIEQLGFAFDPRYFFWFEDVDLCREAKRLGYSVWYTPMISCRDLVGQSVKKQNLWWKQKQFAIAAMQYIWKWK